MDVVTCHGCGVSDPTRSWRARIRPSLVDGGVRPFRLESRKPGVLTNLAWHETRRADPEPGEIEVRVHAGGINFRDVMKALGTYPGRPQDLEWFGDDFAGVVERVGAGVDRWQPGDRVAGMAPYAFRSFATTDARFVFGLPASMPFEDAATIPTVFLTAHHALTDLARLQPGERVLIHAGAGGVGLAAIQVAQQLSLEIFATAGTPEKRALLRSLGVPHVMSSRTLAFADEIMAATDGRGVDAVLNSLAGDFIPRSLSVLAPFGRFIEIGKVDLYRNAKIGLQTLRQNISYHVLDLTQYLREKPALVERLLADVSAAVRVGCIQTPAAHDVPRRGRGRCLPAYGAGQARRQERLDDRAAAHGRRVSVTRGAPLPAGCHLPRHRRRRRHRLARRAVDRRLRRPSPGADEPLRTR